MIPNLHIQRWLSGFRGHRLAHLGEAIRRKHSIIDWESMDTDPAVEP